MRSLQRLKLLSPLRSNAWTSYKELLSLCGPMLIASFVTTVSGITDTALMGNFTTIGLAGVAAGGGVIALVASVLSAATIRHQVVSAKSFGAKMPAGVWSSFWQSMVVIGSLSVLLALLVGWYAGPLTSAVAGSADVVADATAYLQARAPALVMLVPFSLLNATFNAQKRSRIPMLASFFVAVTNVALDFPLIYGAGPLPALGAFGNGLGTTISQAIGLGFLIIMASTKNAFGASMVATWRLEWEEVKQIIALGLPAMLSMLLDYLGMLVLLGLLGRLGSADLAAGRVAQSLRSLLFFWTASLGSSCQILLGRAWGSGSLDSVRILRKRYQPFITGCVALMGLPFVFAPGLLAMPYSPVEQVRNAAAGGILMVGFTAPLMGFAYTNVATLRALGKTKLDMYANILPVWLLQLPVAWFFGLHLGWGVQGVFMGAIAYWLGRSVVTQFFVQPYLSGECAKEVQRDRQPKDTDRSGQRQP